MSRGKTYIDGKGYRRFSDSDYLVHRWVMEKKLDRPLKRSEHVHHRNGDKLDNRPENLELLPEREHRRRHWFTLLRKIEAETIERLTPRIEAQAVRAILIGFACAGGVLLGVGLVTRTMLAMWYIGLLLLVGVLVAWLVQRRTR